MSDKNINPECPKCSSQDLAVERRMNGNAKCLKTGCGWEGPYAECFQKEFERIAEQERQWFKDRGYAVQSKDEHQVLECHLYGMERFCEPDAEFIAASRTDVPRLVKALERAIDQRNQAVWHYELLAKGAEEKSQKRISEDNQELAEILDGKQ